VKDDLSTLVGINQTSYRESAISQREEERNHLHSAASKALNLPAISRSISLPKLSTLPIRVSRRPKGYKEASVDSNQPVNSLRTSASQQTLGL